MAVPAAVGEDVVVGPTVAEGAVGELLQPYAASVTARATPRARKR